MSEPNMALRVRSTPADRERAVALYHENERSGISLRETARQLNLPYSETLRRWVLQQAITEVPVAVRGRPNLLSNDQRKLLAGACLWTRMQGFALHYGTIKDLCMDIFGMRISNTWISRFCHEFNFSRQRARAREPRSFGDTLVESCIQFLSSVRDEDVSPSHLYVMDEKGLWDNEHDYYTLGPRGM